MVTSQIKIDSKGNYLCHLDVLSVTGTNRTCDLAGTWQVVGDVLIDTITNHSQTNAVLPILSRAQIVRLDGRELALKYEESKGATVATNEMIFRRLKQ